MLPGVTEVVKPEEEVVCDSSQSVRPRRSTIRSASGRLHFSESELSRWQKLRQTVFNILESQYFDWCIGAVICFNVAVIIAETNATADCRRHQDLQCEVAWIENSNLALLVIYTLEAAVRVYTYRELILRRGWDMFDLTIVTLSYVDVVLKYLDTDAMPGVQMLRIFRVAKLLRAARLLRVFPELNVMLRGFISAMSAMFWGLLMILVLTLLWAVLAIEFLQPVAMEVFDDDSHCSKSFNGVLNNMLLLFQTLVAGDGWGECSIRIIESSPVAAPFFGVSLVMIQLGLTNLILAVVLEKAAEAHAADVENKQRQIMKQRKAAEERLTELCQDIDEDEDGTISFDELMAFFISSEELRAIFTTLEIHEEDVPSLFMLMDRDGSGDLTYKELANCIRKADTNDLKRQMMVLKLQVQDVWARIRNQVQDSIQGLHQDVGVLASDVRLLLGQASSQRGASETSNQKSTASQGVTTTTSVRMSQEAPRSVEAAIDTIIDHLRSQLDEMRLEDAARAEKAIDAEMTRIRSRLDQHLFRSADWHLVRSGQALRQQESNLQRQESKAKVPPALDGKPAREHGTDNASHSVRSFDSDAHPCKTRTIIQPDDTCLSL